MVPHGPQPLVGRAAEIDSLLPLIAGLRLGAPPQRCLINLCGVYGIGKSALLAALGRRAAEEAGLRVIGLRLPALSPLPSAQRLPLAARLALLDQLVAQAGLARPQPPADEAAADAALAAAAAALAAGPPALVLVEAEDHTAPAAFAWLERGLLLPLVRAGRAGAVIASRPPMRWREFDTLRSAELLALGPLSPQGTAAQLGLGPAAAEAVQALTIGHPLANEQARATLAEHPDPAAWDEATRAALAGSIVAALYARAGPGLTPELRCALEVLAVVREFALPLMRALLPFCPEGLCPPTQAARLGALQRLQELDLVLWDQSSLSYRVAPTLRRLIAGALRRSDPRRYAAIQSAAVSYYRQMLDETLISRPVHLLELLWHTLDSGATLAEPPPATLRRLARTYLAGPPVSGESDALTVVGRLIALDAELPIVLARHGTDRATMLAALHEP
jgi:hypothetical protein